jgi:hypothetical protein
VLWGVLGSLGWQVFAAASAAHMCCTALWDADAGGHSGQLVPAAAHRFAAAGAGLISLGAAAAVYLVR